MDWFAAPDYWLSRLVFQRLLGAIYLVAFLSTVLQFRPLLGVSMLVWLGLWAQLDQPGAELQADQQPPDEQDHHHRRGCTGVAQEDGQETRL